VWPGPDNTGPPAGTTFTVRNGDLNLTTPGQTVNAMHVNGGTILCNAANVIIRNTKVTNHGTALIAYPGCTGLRVNNTEFDCLFTNGTTGGGQSEGFATQNIAYTAVDVHGCEHGFDIDGGVSVYRSWVHAMIQYNPATDPHTDGILMWPFADRVTIDGNVIDSSGDTTSGIITGCPSSSDHVTINHNKLFGGAYTLYLPNHCGRQGPLTEWRVTNNRFRTGAYGPCVGYVNELTAWSGNVVDQTNTPIRC
jgi:hypothetical protein